MAPLIKPSGSTRDSGDVLDPPLFTPPPTLIVPRQVVRVKDVFIYRCPLCGNEFRYDDRYEPMCTGPGWQDTHVPEVMRLLKVDQVQVVV